jgi:hypothetical protein
MSCFSSFRYLTPLERGFMDALLKKCTKKLKYILGNLRKLALLSLLRDVRISKIIRICRIECQHLSVFNRIVANIVYDRLVFIL